MSRAKQGMIPFFIPHVGCPHICIFCHQPNISGARQAVRSEEIRDTIEDYVSSSSHTQWEVAFYGGSFTAIPRSLQETLLTPAKEALHKNVIQGIRCSTRPDAIQEDTIAWLQSFGVSTVELGVQTMDEAMLIRSKRGHTAEDVREAVALLRCSGMTIGLQLLPGLPGETWHTVVHTMASCGQLQPDFVRIYPVLVIEDTELARMYRAGEYAPLSVELALAYSGAMKTYVELKGITVIRTGLQATEEFDAGMGLVAGPYEPAMGEMVVNEQYLEAIRHCLDEWEDVYGSLVHRTVTIWYDRSYTSKVRGVKNRTIRRIEEIYGGVDFQWRQWKEGPLSMDELDVTELLERGYILIGIEGKTYVVKYSPR